MANNFKADGKVVNYVAGGTIVAGQVVNISSDNILGIALKDGVIGDKVPVQITGIWDIVKNTSTDNYAIGQSVFVDTNGKADPDVFGAGNIFLGYATKATTTELTVEVLLVPSVSKLSNVSTLGDDTVSASGTYVQQELQDTMDKIDEVISSLIAAGIMKNA